MAQFDSYVKQDVETINTAVSTLQGALSTFSNDTMTKMSGLDYIVIPSDTVKFRDNYNDTILFPANELEISRYLRYQTSVTGRIKFKLHWELINSGFTIQVRRLKIINHTKGVDYFSDTLWNLWDPNLENLSGIIETEIFVQFGDVVAVEWLSDQSTGDSNEIFKIIKIEICYDETYGQQVISFDTYTGENI